ncbi:MAG TPA: hypothetical protein VIG33_05245 [Pseudobdellovibrionaceae bacterium]|jgi:hypothetical protein
MMGKDAKIEWKFLVMTTCLVATMAVPTLASLITGDGANSPQAAMILSPNEQKLRRPASFPRLGAPKKAVVILDTKRELGNLLSNNLVNYDFSCAKVKATSIQVVGAFLQLKGKDCNKNSQGPKLTIVNKSNGFTASIFLLNTKEYQTDLIQLQEGENQISIQYQTPSGQIEERVLNVKATAI